jgi:hypothetical protein
MQRGRVQGFHEAKVAHYVAPGAWQRWWDFCFQGQAAWHDITMNNDVKARRCGALTLAVRYLTLVVHLQEAHLSKERVAKPPV